MKIIFKALFLIIFIKSINSFLFGGLGGGGSSCCGGGSSCCQSSGGGCSGGGYSSSCGGGCSGGGYSSSCGGGCSGGGYSSSCGGGCSGGGYSSSCGGGCSGGGYSSSCGGGCSGGGYSSSCGGGCSSSSGCGSYSSGGCSSSAGTSSGCGSSCNTGYSYQQSNSGGYSSQGSSCAPTSYSNSVPQTYSQQVAPSPQISIPEPYHQPQQMQVQNIQQYQQPSLPVQNQQPSGGYGSEPQSQPPQPVNPPSGNGYNDVPHHAAADINVEVKSSENEELNNDKKATSGHGETLESEIPPVPIDQIVLINDEDCNVAELREIMKRSIVGDINVSKRKIQIEAEKKFGGRFDVICATHDFSYLSNTELYCQVSSKINNMIFSCYSYRQL
ncbi:Ground-like domain-containing protein [Strongyloides ratti]|uniref:Ground-like domain-containing protein n=1 Tax=Strongyloides ratti TaxID=34506 RepID=A0A090L654_STRRB|nr:Ground-like domain-containing protein [Strongyloides ratti]CEF63004.1 Ground-like domain-containing protein [Strongyloides ratti]